MSGFPGSGYGQQAPPYVNANGTIMNQVRISDSRSSLLFSSKSRQTFSHTHNSNPSVNPSL